jgi:hypothetical protein
VCRWSSIPVPVCVVSFLLILHSNYLCAIHHQGTHGQGRVLVNFPNTCQIFSQFSKYMPSIHWHIFPQYIPIYMCVFSKYMPNMLSNFQIHAKYTLTYIFQIYTDIYVYFPNTCQIFSQFSKYMPNIHWHVFPKYIPIYMYIFQIHAKYSVNFPNTCLLYYIICTIILHILLFYIKYFALLYYIFYTIILNIFYLPAALARDSYFLSPSSVHAQQSSPPPRPPVTACGPACATILSCLLMCDFGAL